MHFTSGLGSVSTPTSIRHYWIILKDQIFRSDPSGLFPIKSIDKRLGYVEDPSPDALPFGYRLGDKLTCSRVTRLPATVHVSINHTTLARPTTFECSPRERDHLSSVTDDHLFLSRGESHSQVWAISLCFPHPLFRWCSWGKACNDRLLKLEFNQHCVRIC